MAFPLDESDYMALACALNAINGSDDNTTCDYDYAGGLEYNNPFDLLSIRIIFILLYGLVFACCFIGEYIL